MVDGNYELQIKEPLWLPEIGLGIGRHQGEIGGIEQEFLSWYDESGNRYLMPEEIAIQQKLKAQAEEEKAERLAQYLRSKGIDPDNLPDN